MKDDVLRISKRTFITSVLILLALMVFSGILTQVLPQGSYQRTVQDGHETVVAGSYAVSEAARMPFWRVFTAPAEVLWSKDGVTVIAIAVFLTLISGSMTLMNRSGIMDYLMRQAVDRNREHRYRLLLLISLTFMLFGSFIGVFEESLTLVPFCVALAETLGWDALTGLGMSMLSAGFGFSSAMTNPFTLAISQRLADLPVYSGLGFHFLSFCIMYALLAFFLLHHARKLDAAKHSPLAGAAVQPAACGEGREMGRGVRVFAVSLAAMILVVVIGIFVPAVSDYAMFLMMFPFTIGSIVAARVSKYTGRKRSDFGAGALGMLPGVVMILMAASIKLIILNGGVLDTILYSAAEAARNLGGVQSAVLIYFFVMILNFFIGSGSAKSFLVMPIIVPLADLLGITRQTAVLAYCYGDGFSNMIYPTNPVVLISVGMAGLTYGKWFRWTWKLQLAVLAICCALVALACAVHLGPF